MAKIALTVCDSTASAAKAAINAFQVLGYEVEAFRSGREMEAQLRFGRFAGVLDLSTAELAEELDDRSGSVDRNRLTVAGLLGLPQVISVGGLDRVGRAENRREATAEDCDRLGQIIAERACAARGPTAIVLPKSAPDQLHALFQSLHNWIAGVEIVEFDGRIDDAAIGRFAARHLVQMMKKGN